MKNEHFKNFSYVAIGRVVSAALHGIFYLVFATIFNPDAYGQMSYLIALAGTFSIIFRFGLPFTVTVYQAKKNHLMTDQINFLVLFTASTSAVILLFINIYAALFCLGLSFFLMSQQNLLGLKEYKKQMWMSITQGSLLIVLTISLYFVLDIPGILLGMGLSTIFTSYYYFKLLKRKVLSLKNLQSNYKVLIHNFGFDVSINLPRMIDKLVIVPILGFAITGLYQFNLQILLLLEIFPLALHQFMLSEESSGTSNKNMGYLAVLGSGLLAIIVILVAPTFVDLFFPKFHEGILGLQLMVISIIPLTISAIINAKLQARESTKVGYAAIVRIGSLLGFIVLLGEQYFLTGLSLAVLFSTSLNAIFLLFLYFKK